MKLSLLFIGKTDFQFIDEGIQLYGTRIKRYTPFEITVIKNHKSDGSQLDLIKTKEGERILEHIKPADYLVLLDERGKKMNSVQFSEFIYSKAISSYKHIIFLIGGAYGFSQAVYKRANEMISLSDMTFSHQLVRILFLEQLYRAYTILNKEPYHHE
jgi:23S rRNA (pseudouridine1915-N3)-methyltransferase